MAPSFKSLLPSRKSKSPSPLPTPTQPTPQNEAAQSSQAISGPTEGSLSVPSSSVAIREGHNYGATVLHDSGQDASVDIVFVHGLTGNAYDTWLHKDSRVHWPRDLLKQDIPSSRILSFGYDADVVSFWNPVSNSRLSNHAEKMVNDLVRKRERTDTEKRRIIFVAHSLGGLVVEQALSHSKNAAEAHLLQIERSTAGIVFLGTPHCGADLAAWAALGTRMASLASPIVRTNRDILTVLEPGSEILRLVENSFHSILRRREEEGTKIQITCFYEELPVTGLGEIVPLRSAEISGYPCDMIHANHMDMTKFPHRNDRGYDAVLGEILRWTRLADRQDNTSTGMSTEVSVME
ncbi:MAG: hypothetical protein Q9191_007691 [Dirinaria sp. TL-2023a]